MVRALDPPEGLYPQNSQRFQTLVYLHLFTACFMKTSLQLVEQVQLRTLPRVIPEHS